jgi:hypothetical protein
MTREEAIVNEVAFDLLTIAPEIRPAYWSDVTRAYVTGLMREGHSASVIDENYNAFAAAIAARLAALTQHGPMGSA